MAGHSMLVNLCLLLILGFSLSSGQATPPKNVICLYRSYHDLLHGFTPYTIAELDPTICTHIVYYSTYLDTNLKMVLSESDYNQWEELNALHASYPSVKFLLGVDDFDSDMESESYETRQTLINDVIAILREWDFNGIDFVWYSEVTQGIVTFIQEMHDAFVAEAASSGKEPLIIMFTVPGWDGAIQGGLDLQPLGQAVDILDVTLYKYNPGSNFHIATGLANPLYGNGGYRGNMAAAITSYLDAGVAPEKLHMVIELFATTFTLLEPDLTEVGAPAQGLGHEGEYTQEKGQLSYYEVCKRLQEEGYTAEVDPEGMVNFAYKDDQWMTYEDPDSLEAKMDYVYEHNLGGVSVRYPSEDDYTGEFCNQGKYPLISALYRLASETQTTTPQPLECPYSIEKFPDPYSCQHYIMCVWDQLFRATCDSGLTYDSQLKECVQNPTTTCVTAPLPQGMAA